MQKFGLAFFLEFYLPGFDPKEISNVILFYGQN
jgi:hypothetical protein